MGKSARKKGKGKLDFESFFDSTKPASEGDGVWHTGVSAMMLDEGADAAAATQPSTSGAVPAAAAADAMDTKDFVPIGRGKQKGLRVQQPALKISKRGSRTTTQKKRKAAKQEKALARAEMLTTRASNQLKKKHTVAALKTLY